MLRAWWVIRDSNVCFAGRQTFAHSPIDRITENSDKKNKLAWFTVHEYRTVCLSPLFYSRGLLCISLTMRRRGGRADSFYPTGGAYLCRQISIPQQHHVSQSVYRVPMTFVSPAKSSNDVQVTLRVISPRQRRASAANTQFLPTVPLPYANRHIGCNKRQSFVIRNAAVMDVLGTQDLVEGSLLAFALALSFSFLQERRRDRPSAPPTITLLDSLSQKNTTTASNNVFDSWNEMSRQENYVYYNNKVKQRRKRNSEPLSIKREKKWVLVALLVLFIPIFSAEFFLALSRQILCGGNPITQSSWAAELCSPHL